MEGYKERLEALIQSKEGLYRDLLSQENADVFESAKDLVVQGLLNGQRVFFCGNGGSFAQAQHLAAELVAVLRIVHRLLRFVWGAVVNVFRRFQ